jgi:hypothetical protein
MAFLHAHAARSVLHKKIAACHDDPLLAFGHIDFRLRKLLIAVTFDAVPSW